MTDAKEYGRALFLITEEDSKSKNVLADVKAAECVFQANPEYVKLLDSPALSKEERVGLVGKAFSSVDEMLLNLIKILTERREVHLFSKIAEEYSVLYDASRGIERVEAITARPMTEKQKALMTEKLGKTLAKTVILTNTVDPSILGGVKLRYLGTQLDGSVKTRLTKFEDALKNTVI